MDSLQKWKNQIKSNIIYLGKQNYVAATPPKPFSGIFMTEAL